MRRIATVLPAFASKADKRAGKIVLSTMLMVGIAILPTLYVFYKATPEVQADVVSTSVTVLNTAPAWTVNAEESTESSTSTPTNSGATITWTGTGTDSSSDNYYLIICKSAATPTANASAAPSCGGGVSNQWAVSASTVSGNVATAATTTKETFPFENEKNDWWAWICDANASLPRCNIAYTQGAGDEGRSSPFVINHPPVFSLIANDGPLDPGDTITWTATAADPDTLETPDQVRLLVCRANDYAGGECGGGGTWATSTITASNPATTTTLIAPVQDGLYPAYVYVIDNHLHQATSSNQGFNSSFTVNNVAPTFSSGGDVVVNNGSNMTIAVPMSTSGPFTVNFTITDNNSCLNVSAGNEIASAIANIYRSGVGQSSCDASGEYSVNSCYVNASPLFSPHISCTQNAGGGNCSGAGDPTVDWTCTFSLWYTADPTDGSTPWTAENWLASVQVTDDDAATSALTESSVGREVTSFLSFDVSSTSIPFGSMEPGTQSALLATSTDLIATGNVGLDEDLYGDTMCTSWTAPDSCDNNGFQAAGDILIANQKVATTTRTYGHAEAYTMLGSTTPRELTVRVPKTTATSTPNVRYTFWGINIPIAITTSGSYSGQNTLVGKTSPAAFW